MTFEYMFDEVDARKDVRAYQRQVASRAAEGWRLVQILVELPAAVPGAYVLVLERPTAP